VQGLFEESSAKKALHDRGCGEPVQASGGLCLRPSGLVWTMSLNHICRVVLQGEFCGCGVSSIQYLTPHLWLPFANGLPRRSASGLEVSGAHRLFSVLQDNQDDVVPHGPGTGKIGAGILPVS